MVLRVSCPRRNLQKPPIIHRDLKTANLLIGANFMCKVRGGHLPTNG